MSKILKAISKTKIFEFFEDISNIPRGSGNMKAISDYCVNFAKNRNLEVIQDDFLNVIIKKKASKGYENKETIILQGHLDMVCEKNSNVEHNFINQGLKLCVDDDFIFADGTTLGGDDGIAIAYALAILDDDSIEHPDLEVLFTTDEETGMDGAIGLDVSLLKGKTIINLDSEEEGEILVSCAGGIKSKVKFDLEYVKSKGILAQIFISGLLGGHSGTDIDKNKANSNILLGRILYNIKDYIIGIKSISGGLKDNAIPREAKAEILILEENLEIIKQKINNLLNDIKNEYIIEKNINIEFISSKEKIETDIIKKEIGMNLITYLFNTLNGVYTMSSNIDGLVESSLNLGVIDFQKNFIEFDFAVRSSKKTIKKLLTEKIKSLAEILGGVYFESGEYPEWEYNENSKLREKCIKIYRDMFNKDLKIKAIHAGLECGIFAEKIKDIDMISIGPDIFDIHTPNERLSISSAKRTYKFLLELLK